MKLGSGLLLVWGFGSALAAPQFNSLPPVFQGQFQFKTADLCATATQTLAYLNQGAAYDPAVIHGGKIAPIPLNRIKATLKFVCAHQAQMNDPAFIKQHFEFIHWYPDRARAQQLAANKPLLQHIPKDQILMTKYYVHLAEASSHKTASKPYALYALPADESHLTLEQANAQPQLVRFKYGKQAVLKGALTAHQVPQLAYLTRDDLESALLQGTIVANFGNSQLKKIFNVHRNNNIAYDRRKDSYSQERFWYFKEVDGIKGYGKDAENKITVNPAVTFAADLNQFGLGRLLLVQYHNDAGSTISKVGVFADTGGAFADNLYQVDYLAGAYAGKNAFIQAARNLPDYVSAYFMVVKE
ncbi:MAG: hypothetical protein EPN84_01470 [Legionella sp.]|nr:MAG: hypothetical protein EPN84_01470 [Legionella sp.]